MNPCRNEEWLSYHYLRKDAYTKWCEQNRIEICPHGGQGLTLTECSVLAGVTPQCISNWLHKFNLGTRDLAEAQIGKFNHRYGRTVPASEKRDRRDAFFELYRAGTINIIIGDCSFSNGILTSKEETAAQRTRRRALAS